MNKKNIVKKDLLRRKIFEYFSKNPNAKSVVIKADVGEAKTLWKVVREGATFRIVEVNTKREEFILESGIPVVQEASVEFSNLSRQFVQAMTPPFDHVKLSNVLKAANVSVAKIVDPKEKQEIGSMIGALTNMVDTTTAGGGSKIQMKKTTTSTPITTMGGSSSTSITSGKKNFGTVLREDENKKDKKDDKSDDSEPKKTKPKPKKDPEPTDKLEPDSAEDDVGIETGAELDEPQDVAPVKQPSSEEMVVSKSLAGQTIKAANIQLKPDGGEFTLDLVSSAVPAKLQWSKTGKVVFYANGRPYVLNRG